MLRIPLLFHREFWACNTNTNHGHRVVCEYEFPSRTWLLTVDGIPISTSAIPNISPDTDAFRLVSDDRSYKDILKRWANKMWGYAGMKYRNKFAYLHYALTDKRRARPIWNVWGGTLRYGEPKYCNRTFNLFVSGDGRMLRERTALTNGLYLSDSLLDRWYQARGGWVAVYDTSVSSRGCKMRLLWQYNENPNTRIMPDVFSHATSKVMFQRKGHLYIGSLLVCFPRESRNAADWSFAFRDVINQRNGSAYHGDYCGKALFGPVPKSIRDASERYTVSDLQEMYQCILDDVIPEALRGGLV